MISDPRSLPGTASAQEAGGVLTPPEVRAVYVVDDDGALTGVLTRKTLVAKVVAAGLDPRRHCDRRASRRSRTTRSMPTRRSTRPSASSRSTTPSACRWSSAAASSACSRAACCSGASPRTRSPKPPPRNDLDRRREGPRRNAGLRGSRPSQQRRRLADAGRGAADGDRAPRAGGEDRRLRGCRARGRPGRGDLRQRRPPARLLARRGRDRRERHPRLGHGLLLVRLPAGRPDPDVRRRVRVELHRAAAGRAAHRGGRGGGRRRRERPGVAERARAGAGTRCPARLARPRPLAGWADPAGGGSGAAVSGGGRAAAPRCVPVGRVSCPPTCASSSATSSPPRAASSCAARGEPGSSTCGRA